MSPLLRRSPSQSLTQNDWLTRQPDISQSQQLQQPSSPTNTNPLTSNSILAIVGGILIALFFALIIFSIARKRQQRPRSQFQSTGEKPRSMAQLNFLEKCEEDRRNKSGRDTWSRASFEYAAETGTEKPRRVLDRPEKIWVITPMAPVVVRS